MAIQPVPEEQLRSTQDELLRRALDRAGPVVNLQAATTAHDTLRLKYHGRWYTVPYVRFRAYLELVTLRSKLTLAWASLDREQPQPEVLGEILTLSTTALDIMGTLIKWRWWQVRNPLADAEPEEFEALLDFFSTARTRSPVRADPSTRAHPYFRQTWATRWPILSLTSPDGLGPMGHRAAPGTSNSAPALSLIGP